MDDHDLHAALRACPATAAVARRLDHRDLFKRAVWVERGAVPDRVLDADHDTVREFEADIASAAGIDPEHVLVDRPPVPRMAESTARILDAGEVHRLDERSPLVEALRAAQHEQWRFGVYTPAAEADAVGVAAADVLDLDADHGLVSSRRGRLVQLDEFTGGDA
jgi:HD superfamily phosphohydrolase